MQSLVEAFPVSIQDLFSPAQPAGASAPEPASIGELRSSSGTLQLPGPQPELHPALWHAHQMGRQQDATWPSGFDALDAELPGRGWPSRGLSELLIPHPGIGEVRLLAPALAAVQQQGRSVMLFDPPQALCGWTLSALGLDLRRLVIVYSARSHQGSAPKSHGRSLQSAADLLWALEHSLKSGQAGAVLAWAPVRIRSEALRRLQLAAQSHEGPAFLVREPDARTRPSAAALRLWLSPAGPDELALRIVKRRGPPRQQPLVLVLAPVLSDPARARASRLVTTPVAEYRRLRPLPALKD